MMNALLRSALLLALVAALGLPAQAQRYEQYARAAMPSAQVIGMGGAGVGLAGPETAFFYNPAHFAKLGLLRPRIEILGVRAEASTKIFEDVDFFFDRVEPAISEGDGIDYPLDQDERDLFVDALAQGARPTVGQAAVMAPSVMFGVGNFGFGAGVFANTTTRYRFRDNGSGIPIIDLFGQGDAMAVVGAAAAIPTTNLSVGLTGKYVQRYIGYKFEELLAIDPDSEQLYVINGSTVTFDLGLQYTDVFGMLPGSLDFGLAIYDLVGGSFDYEEYRAIDLTGEDGDDPDELASILADFEDRDGNPSFRIGASYGVPRLAALPIFSDVDVALDYVSENTSESDQPFLSKFRLGGQATLAGFLALRAGVSQGYPTFGAGIETRFMQLGYVFYGVEDGRLPGQIERYNHLVQVRFGLF
jgi:hypothetical protein